MAKRAGSGVRPRYRHRAAASGGSDLQCVRYDEASRDRYGTIHQPIHCRIAWRTLVGFRELSTRRDLLHCPAKQSRGAFMTSADTAMVFVIDDDAAVRESIQGLLKSVGLRSDSFGTAQEFLTSEREDGPSCLVLDIRLPGTNGLDFQRQLADAG